MSLSSKLHLIKLGLTLPPHVSIPKAYRLIKFSLKNGSRHIIHRRNRKKYLADLNKPIEKLIPPPIFFDSLIKKTALNKTKQTILKEADLICQNKINLLGSENTFLGKKINWHRDFINNQTWPDVFFTKISSDNRYGGKDIKVPWELSRFQFLPILGQAYLLTQDPKYAQKFKDLINDWLDKNPVFFGVNWCCTMDVAIRACNLLLALPFFKDAKEIIDEPFLTRFFNSIYQHGIYIEENLENRGLKGNHYLSDIVGLIYIGILCPQFKKSKKWLQFGVEELEKEIQTQVYNDGADFEGSIPYHRLATELFAYPALLCRLNKIKLSEKFWNKLEKMFEFTLSYTQPNGLAPQIGDNDNGRLHILSNFYNWEVNDHRYLLDLAAVLFSRADFKTAGKIFPADAKKPLSSKFFPDCGICVMKHRNWQITVDAGPNGQDGNGGHGHNDTLSFTLQAFGEDIIVDPGTYVYTPDPEARNRFRSTRLHNTVMIDQQEINRFSPETLFMLHNDAIPEVKKWETTKQKDLLIAEHNGYQRFTQPVTHQRQFIFSKSAEQLEITDTFRGHGQHELEWNFHFAPGIQLKKEKDRLIISRPKKPISSDSIRKTSVSPTAKTLQLILPSVNLKPEILDYEYSPSYGLKEKASKLTLKHKANLQKSSPIFSLLIRHS